MSWLVEASAGSGKTYSLVERLVQALLEEGLCPSQIAAVTFTRKAAAELRSRLRIRLEKAAGASGTPRAEAALSQLDRMFVGTVHSFCATLLRQYPVEAGIGPHFEELDEQQDLLLQHQVLRQVVDSPDGRRVTRLLQEMGAELADVHAPLSWMCDHAEVDYPASLTPRPALEEAWNAVEQLAERLKDLVSPWDPTATCPLFHLSHRLLRGHSLSQRDNAGDLLAVLNEWSALPKPVKRYWGAHRAEQTARLEQLQQWHHDFRKVWVEDYLGHWQAHLYGHLVRLLDTARQRCRSERIRSGRLNFHDLLFFCAQLLRHNPEVRRELQQRLRLLCVDEFQDTDPLQAEVFFLLASDRAEETDWTAARPRPNSLFLVGDPKQSIYRFRRADIQLYRQARQLLLAQGAHPRALQQSYRSVPELCDWLNRVFGSLFNGSGPDYQPLAATRASDGEPAVWALPVACERLNEVASCDARLIAAHIQSLCQQGRYGPKDFMILTMRKADMAVYQRALKAAGVPCQVGLESAPMSSRGRSLLRLLQALSRPDDRIALVGLLRGELLGHSDSELWLHFSGQGPSSVDRTLEWLDALRQELLPLPPGASLQRALARLGLCWENDPESRALVDALGTCAEAGWTLHEACQELLEQGQVRQPPGQQDEHGVRILNLHRAKGLEAPIVFLAAPTQGLPRYAEHAVRRESGRAQAAFCLRKQRKVLARPLDWSSWEQDELQQLEQEHLRLLYVAATRAGDCLIVSQWSDDRPGLLRPWEPLGPYLVDCPRLRPGEPTAPEQVAPELLDTAALRQHLARQQEHSEACSRPSWKRLAVTADPARSGLTRQPAPDNFSPGGVAWGDLMHRMLEKMVANPDYDRSQLERLARWYAFDLPELQDHIDTALDSLERIRQTPFWSQVLNARQRLVEVPFAQRVEENWLFGILDLALDQGQGWHIVDYKTDRKSLEELVDHYAAQVQQYARSWRDITEESVSYAGLFGVREGRLSPDLA